MKLLVVVASQTGRTARMAEAIAILGERVLDVGSAEVLARWTGPRTRVIDLRGRLVTPGMNDAHLHFESGGVSLLQVGLLGANSLAEIEERHGVLLPDELLTKIWNLGDLVKALEPTARDLDS